MALNYDYYCLGENNRLYFADRNYIGYSDNYLTEAKKVKYDTAGDNLYYFGHYNNKLYMVKKYALYEIDPITLNLTKLAHNTTFFDWYNTSYGILSNLLYYTTRYNAETSYHVLNLDTKQIVNISVATYNLLTHADSVPAVSFKGINKVITSYDSVNKTYSPTLERYELNSKCELEKASVITVPVSLSRITKAFPYDDNHVGVYANSLISIYNIHTGALLHQITSTVQSSYVIYGLRSSSNDFITLIKESSSSVKLYSNTKILKTHTTFKDFKRQGQVVTYIVYRADDAIQVVKVGIQKQSGSIPLSLSERIYAQDKQLLDLQEKAYAEAYTALQLNERIVMSNEDTVPLKERTVETIHTLDLKVQEEIIRPNYERLKMHEKTVNGGLERLRFTEGVPDKGTHTLSLTGRITNGSELDLTLKEGVEQHYSNYGVLFDQEIVRIERQGQNIILSTTDNKLYISTDNGMNFKEIMANTLDSISRDNFACNENYFFLYNFYYDKIMVYDQKMILKKSIQDPPTMIKIFKALKDVLVFDNTLLDIRNDKRYYIGNNITENARDFRINREQTEITYTVFRTFPETAGYSLYRHELYCFNMTTGENTRIDLVERSYNNPSTYHAAFGIVAIFDQTIKFYDLRTNKALFEIDDRSQNASFSFFALDNEKEVVTVIDRRDKTTGLNNYRLYQNDKLFYDSEATAEFAYPPLCAIDAYNPIFVTTWSSCNNKLITHFVGNPIFEADRYLGLKEQVMECQTVYVKEAVEDAKDILYLNERVVEFATQTLSLKENVMAGTALLDIEENVLAYSHSSAVSSLKEKVTPPHQDFDDLNVYERVNFKPGEWGEGKRNLSLSGKVVPVPYQAIWVKGEVINKPVPTDSIDLGLKENVWAYHTFITQKENAWSDKVYWYYRDGILGDAVYVQEGKTAFITTEWTIMAHDKVIFEVDSKNIILDSVRLDTLDGLKFETIRNIKCDSYTLKDAYTGEIKQVYGFVIDAPFDCNSLQIRNKGKGFTLLKLYDGYNPSTIGAHYLNLTETIESQSSALPMGETIWWEGQAHKRYFNLTERVYAKAPTDKTIPIKGEVGGLDGSQTAALKGVVKLSDLDVYSTLYSYELGKPYETIKQIGLPAYLHDNYAALIAFPREKVNWDGRALLQIQAEWHDWWLVIGYRKTGSEAIEQVLCMFNPLKSYQIDASFDITMYLHHFIKSQLGHADLITDRIAYIGVMGANYQGGMTINSMQMTRHNYQSQVTLGTKEEVISHVRASYQPLHLQTTEGTYTYNEVIDFTPIMAAPTDYDVFTYLEKRFFASQIELASEDKVLFATLELTNEKVHEVHATTMQQQNGRYYYTYDTSNIADCMINKLAFRYEKRHETKIYELILYHDGYRVSDKFMLKENIPRPFDKQVAIKENVMLVPEVTLPLKEEVDKLIKESTAISLREYVAMPDHSVGNADLKLQEKSVPPTYSRSIWLNELVPSEPQKNALNLHEYVIANEAHDLTLTEKVVQYKANRDGKVIIENVKH